MLIRPTRGQTTTTIIRTKICGDCGFAIDMYGCNYGCPYDFSEDPDRPIITAVYERQDRFIGDE